jgi:hypothetical protein
MKALQRVRVYVVYIVGGIRGCFCKFVLSLKLHILHAHVGLAMYTTYTRTLRSLLADVAGGFKAEFLLFCVYVGCFMYFVNILIAMTEVICLGGYRKAGRRVHWRVCREKISAMYTNFSGIEGGSGCN